MNSSSGSLGVIENLVDVWLTEASERSYETAFGQLLVIEGHRVIQGPMHHAHEHGKDIIALDSEGNLCAYQLKGGRKGKLDKSAVEEAQNQLFTAAATAVLHPSLPTPRPPDRVYLVTNQHSTGPAQGQIHALSAGNRHRGLAPLQLIERAELASRFVAAEGRFFPSSPQALNTFLSLFLADGRGELPRRDFFRLLQEIIPVSGSRPKAAVAGRAISAAALTTAFALRKWADADNHAEIAMGWICYATQVLRAAERYRLGRSHWERPYRLALEETRRHARHLLNEASAADDLTIPDPAEPFVYAARVVKVCGLVSAWSVSQRIEFGVHRADRGAAGRLVLRELDYFQVVGEIQAPDYFLSLLAVSEAGNYRLATSMLFRWLNGVAAANQRDSTTPIPHPYHAVEDVLHGHLSLEGAIFADEDFAGSAYTVHIGVRWAARRLWRQALNASWGNVSRISHYSFEPSGPTDYLTPKSSSGKLTSWFYPSPTSWSTLRSNAEHSDFSVLPRALRRCPEFVPFYCLSMPHRFNSIVSDLLDHLAYGGQVS
ncbi:MAG: hypothetical protein F4205_08425 [Gemmatimonadetes bacterium]|nr:hypothetical protein [Gemmatimonadota bacterium]MYG35506.1 hypothetical protein [Gemmatimonadota bacterium]